jgi:AraC-like DNA-binding protein
VQVDPACRPRAFRRNGAAFAFRGRLRPGVVGLLARTQPEQQRGVTFGLCTAPAALRTLTASFRIPANTPWAVRSSSEWRLAVSEVADLRLVHCLFEDVDLVEGAVDLQRPTRFEGPTSKVVRAAIRSATPVWLDGQDNPIANLSGTGEDERRRLAGSRPILGGYDLDTVHSFVLMVTWALGQQDGSPDPRLGSVVQHISDNLADPTMTTTTIAADVRLSRRTLQSLFTEHGGIAAYVRRQRVASAVQMLTDDPRAVPDLAQVASATGLGSPRTLQRSMRHVYGLTPLQARSHVLAGFLLRERSVGGEPAAS